MLADDPEAVWPVIRPHLSYMWDSYNRYAVEGARTAPAPAPDRSGSLAAPGKNGAPPRFGVFTPDQAAEHIRAVTDGLPAVQVYLWASIAGIPDDLVHRHVELACTTATTSSPDAGNGTRRRRRDRGGGGGGGRCRFAVSGIQSYTTTVLQ